MKALCVIILVASWIFLFRGIDQLITVNLNLAFASAIMHLIAAAGAGAVLVALWAVSELVMTLTKPPTSRK